MARNSRHKSHRSHKHRDRSESEDDGNSRDKKPRAEEEEVRVSRVSDQEKTKSSTKDNGDVSGDHGKTRKGNDRWKGGGDDDSRVEKESRKEGFDVLNLDKSSKSKSSSTRRHDGSGERNEEKRRSEKESGRRENSSRYTDGKEKEKVREREKDKKVEDSKNEKSEDRTAKHDVEISELQENMRKPMGELQENMRKPKVEKELDRQNRRRDGYSDHDGVDDWKKSDDKQASYRDERTKNGSYKDGRYKEKYREDLDRDQRHRDDKRRDECSSRTHTGERSESKHYRDENKITDSRDKKTKLQDSDHDGIRHGDDYSTKFKDTRGRKRSSCEIEDHNDMKPQSAKEARKETTKNTSSSSKLDSRPDRVRLEHSHIDKVASSMSISRTKNSPNNNTYAAKDQNRHSSRQPESTTYRESLSGDARRSSAVSRDCLTSSGRDRMPECRSSEKARVKDNIHSDVLMSESHHDRIARSDTHTLPNQLTEKSPSTNERRSERSTARRSDAEEGGQRSSSSRGGREREYLAEKPSENDISPLGPSPGRLPPPPNRFGSNSSSVLGAYEDEIRIQSGDPKTNARYKRGRDASVGRGPGTPWKGSAPAWPSQVANGFMPLQHGPPPSFHPVGPQFPASTLFGSRPPMDLNNNGNRFPGHVPRPYGWHNSVDDHHPPHLQMWDGNPNIFGNEWDRNRLLMGGRGWEMGTDNIWSGQNGNVSVEFPPVPQEHEYSRQAQVHEAWIGQSGNQSRDERPGSEQPKADGGSGINPPNDLSFAKQALGAPSKSLYEKASKIPSVKGIADTHSDGNGCYCSTYLSKLDISPDLVQPDLYKQCISLLDAAGRLVAHNVPIQGGRKKNVESFRLVTKCGQFNSIYPIASDAIFQRAMSLYRKQKEGMKAVTSQVTPLALPLCSQNNPPESKEGETVAETLWGEYREEDKGMAVAVVEGDAEKMLCENKSVDAEEIRCDNKLSDAVVLVEGSEGSEAKLVPECRENISRMLLCPESTH